ncbi:GEVED domain-containing protein [Hymenobacter terrestris]|uniref:T9SS type A sorting domain-containing protein n=1 Tax=Hymenobacter terrestris TaxID=2748310 RepID=A0ABX2PXY3_9BACT|nr:GEVED domain-containing protein [Hymenobacter terrestris]NVO83545.1 T9SS type A sorting domain-containing protein [Hymenobacter terrestris]
MNKLYAYGLGMAMLAAAAPALAQNRAAGPTYSLGSPQNLVRQLETEVAADVARRQPKPTVSLRVAANQNFTGQVNYREDLASTGEYLVGELVGVPNSSFFVRIEGTQVEGHIVLRDTKRAYRYSTDAQGNAQVQEVDINQVICINYDKPVGYQAPEAAPANRAAGMAAAVVSLQSLPGAKGCIYIDLDGQYVSGTPWNNGNPIDAAPSGIQNDAAKVQAFWELVSEDFRPFDMNVTTDEAVFNAYPLNMRMRVIVTPTNTAAPGAGGVAYLTSFRYNNDTPCWVFMNDPKAGGEAASHEVGHTLGLSHDGRTSPSEGYYQGQGSWAPIMGVGYYKPISQWSKGEYANANQTQDDLAIMSGPTYNVGYRADDHGNTTGTATPLARSGDNLTGNGLIERTDDQDHFSFTTSGGAVSFNINTVARYGNLDVVVRLLNSTGGLVGTYDTGGSLNATVSTTLGAGTYFLQVDGTGAANPATDGYSDYGSLGTFTVAGTAPAGGTPPPPPPPTTPPTPPTPPVAVTYCASKGNNVSYEWIDLVRLGSINRTSGADGGYYNGTALNTNIAAGSAQTINISAGFRSTAYNENWRIYIDYNQDGDFTDAGETVVSGASSSSATLSATFTVPSSALTGKTRMRVTMSDNASTTSCNSFTYGETEDYSVTIIGGAAGTEVYVAAQGATVGDGRFEKALTLYPNPTASVLNIVLAGKAPVVSASITDLRGAKVANVRFENGQLNVANLATGVYLLTVSDGQKTFHERFMKQ